VFFGHFVDEDLDIQSSSFDVNADIDSLNIHTVIIIRVIILIIVVIIVILIQ